MKSSQHLKLEKARNLKKEPDDKHCRRALRLSRRELLERWQANKKQTIEAQKNQKLLNMRFQDMLRNDQISFYRINSSSRARESSQNIFERLSKFASKERSRNPSAQANKSSTKKKKSHSKYLSKRGHETQSSEFLTEDDQNKSRLNVSQVAQYSNLALLDTLNDENSKNSRLDVNFQIKLKDNQISKCVQNPSRLNFEPEAENRTHKQNECRNLTQSFSMMADSTEVNKLNPLTEKQGTSEDNLEDLVERFREEKMDLECQASESFTQPVNANEQSNLFEESFKKEFSSVAMAIETEGEELVKKLPQSSHINPQLEGFSVILEGLYQNYKNGKTDWRYEFEKIETSPSKGLKHFWVFQNKFQPSDEIGEFYTKDPRFCVLLLQYIRDRAIKDEEFRNYQSALSQALSIEIMQKGIESFIDLQNPSMDRSLQGGTTMLMPNNVKEGNAFQFFVSYPESIAEQKLEFTEQGPKQEIQEHFCTPRQLKIIGIKENPEVSAEEPIVTRRKRRRVLLDDEPVDEEEVSTHKTKKSQVKSKNNEEESSRRVEIKDVFPQENEQNSIGLNQFGSGLIYAMVSLKKSQHKKCGVAEMLTPIRASRRIQTQLQKKIALQNGMDIEDGFEFDKVRRMACTYIQNPSLNLSWTAFKTPIKPVIQQAKNIQPSSKVKI